LAEKGYKVKNKVWYWRKQINLSQEELAQIVGASQTSISDIEIGSHIPSVIIAIKISRALGKPVEKVFFIDEMGGDR
jgi:putative transcriptional regulator